MMATRPPAVTPAQSGRNHPETGRQHAGNTREATVTDRIPIMADGLPEIFHEALGDRYEVLDWDPSQGSDALARSVAIISYAHPLADGELMDRMANLVVISNHGVGVDHIDLVAARERDIPVGNTPGCLDAATADMTMALVMAVGRNLRIGDLFARSSEFLHYDPSILIGQEITGSTLGIIGMGRIGKEVARRAAGFDMTVLYHNRNRDEVAEAELGVQYATRDELLAASDFVTLNCPLSDETTGMIGPAEFETMKTSAFLVNMARGPVVQTDALHTALTTGQIRGAALDVTDPEPLPRDHPLLGVENVIILPHLGSASNRAREMMMNMSIENLEAGLAGEELPYRILPPGSDAPPVVGGLTPS
jgi:glyoxylate reductase